MLDKMKQLYEMQKKAKELQKQLEGVEIEKSSRDGLLRVNINGLQKVEAVSIDASYLTPDKKEALERGLAGLLNEAMEEIQKQTAAQAAGMMKGFPGF
jgi:DNA-binding YbaB/EbfC family protein